MFIHRGGFQQISNRTLKQFWKTCAPPLAGKKRLSCKSIQIDNLPQDIKYSDVFEDVEQQKFKDVLKRQELLLKRLV